MKTTRRQLWGRLAGVAGLVLGVETTTERKPVVIDRLTATVEVDSSMVAHLVEEMSRISGIPAKRFLGS